MGNKRTIDLSNIKNIEVVPDESKLSISYHDGSTKSYSISTVDLEETEILGDYLLSLNMSTDEPITYIQENKICKCIVNTFMSLLFPMLDNYNMLCTFRNNKWYEIILDPGKPLNEMLSIEELNPIYHVVSWEVIE